MYQDPNTGLFVLTEAYLKSREACCGSCCRHCPYGHINVKPENRNRNYKRNKLFSLDES
jgi:ATP-binding cassette subfamily B (MDR/TAP) protein 1